MSDAADSSVEVFLPPRLLAALAPVDPEALREVFLCSKVLVLSYILSSFPAPPLFYRAPVLLMMRLVFILSFVILLICSIASHVVAFAAQRRVRPC